MGTRAAERKTRAPPMRSARARPRRLCRRPQTPRASAAAVPQASPVVRYIFGIMRWRVRRGRRTDAASSASCAGPAAAAPARSAARASTRPRRGMPSHALGKCLTGADAAATQAGAQKRQLMAAPPAALFRVAPSSAGARYTKRRGVGLDAASVFLPYKKVHALPMALRRLLLLAAFAAMCIAAVRRPPPPCTDEARSRNHILHARRGLLTRRHAASDPAIQLRAAGQLGQVQRELHGRFLLRQLRQVRGLRPRPLLRAQARAPAAPRAAPQRRDALARARAACRRW